MLYRDPAQPTGSVVPVRWLQLDASLAMSRAVCDQLAGPMAQRLQDQLQAGRGGRDVAHLHIQSIVRPEMCHCVRSDCTLRAWCVRPVVPRELVALEAVFSSCVWEGMARDATCAPHVYSWTRRSP